MILRPNLLVPAALFFCFSIVHSNASTDKGPEIRVLVAGNRDSLIVSAHGPYEILLLPSLEPVKKGVGFKNAVFTVAPQGVQLGQDVWPASGVRIRTAQENGLFIKKSRFRGTLDIYKFDAALYAVNRLPLESYLYGVLHYEVSPWWPMEALKAQAIAARTYALYESAASKGGRYDVKSGTSSQVYGGSTTERFRTKRAVDLTAGEVLTFKRKVFPAYFHATCAGLTAGADELWKISLKPLSGKVACKYCKISPHSQWKVKVPLAEIEEKAAWYGRPVGRILSIHPISQTPSRRVGSLKVTGVTGEAVVAAKDFRVWVGGDRIRSTRFTVTITDDFAQFKGDGWGHGVGLCQWGTFGQALSGKKVGEILEFYYPGAKITKS